MSSTVNDRIDRANAIALQVIRDARPVLIDLRPAGTVIPGLGEHDLLHAGPPLGGWHEACGALRGATLATILRAGFATTLADAEAFAKQGPLRLLSAHDFGAVGTFAGLISARTPVFVVENRTTGVLACAAINEGRGKALRYGSTDPDSLARVVWLETELSAVLRAAILSMGGIELNEILSQALQMGDDGHSRQKAASALFLSAIAPSIAGSGLSARETTAALSFLAQNDFFFLPLAMAAAKASIAAVERTPYSSIVTCMAFNGVRCGIRVGGLGSRWYTAPVPEVHGHYFEGYGPPDAGPVIGDSEITETLGLGAFAMASAPALARYVGRSTRESIGLTTEMYQITLSEHPKFTIPALEFRGTPMGIDVRRVVETGIEPVFNTGIAHREQGVGQIGAGYGRTPLAAFKTAFDAMVAEFSAG